MVLLLKMPGNAETNRNIAIGPRGRTKPIAIRANGINSLTKSRRHYCHIGWQPIVYPERRNAPAALPKQAARRFPGIFSGMHGSQAGGGPVMSGLCQRHSRLSSCCRRFSSVLTVDRENGKKKGKPAGFPCLSVLLRISRRAPPSVRPGRCAVCCAASGGAGRRRGCSCPSLAGCRPGRT